MKTRLFIATFVLVSATCSAAFADPVSEEEAASATETAPRNALEIGVSAGFTQPFGDIESGRSFGDLVDAGGAVALELAYRATPHFAIGWSMHYHESEVDPSFTQNHDIRGAAATVMVTHHALPFERWDPYISAGVGYRCLWIVPEGPEENTLLHGPEVAALMVGVDFRPSDDVAFGPMLGADVNVLLWGADGMIDQPRPSTFVFAGVAGRFDLLGSREAKDGTVVTGSERPTQVSAR